jgi:solute carrier family 27 fatty acid transporter 1/4
VGKIDFRKVATHFNGYADDGATEKKILRDVARHGDAAFNTGDVLVEDEYGYYYFKDRTGDTFRYVFSRQINVFHLPYLHNYN